MSGCGFVAAAFVAERKVAYTAEDVKKFHEKAEKGDVDSQIYLGACYLNGYGVAVDEKKGCKWVH